MSCEARKNFIWCAAHVIVDWIPAFAGMTDARFSVVVAPALGAFERYYITQRGHVSGWSELSSISPSRA